MIRLCVVYKTNELKYVLIQINLNLLSYTKIQIIKLSILSVDFTLENTDTFYSIIKKT